MSNDTLNYISNLVVPLTIFLILIFGYAKRIEVYDAFIDGAATGIKTAFNIMAPLIGLMVAINMFRASGALDILTSFISPVTNRLGVPNDVIPLALLRPVSGSASLAMVTDIFENFGPDSLQGRIASIMMGSTETTFYTIAVYFGCVGVKNVRYTVFAALCADFTGMALSILLA